MADLTRERIAELREEAKQDISTLEANGNFAAAGVMRAKFEIGPDEELPPSQNAN